MLFHSVALLTMQGLLCGVLQVVIQKLSESDSAKTGLLEKADSIMQALLGVFQCHAGSVHEEAMLAVGALTYACAQSFTKYMQSFYPVLKLGLENHRVGLGQQSCHLPGKQHKLRACLSLDLTVNNACMYQTCQIPDA